MSVLLAQVSASPDSGALPGGDQAQSLLNGLLFFGLLACVAGIVVAVIAKVIFEKLENPSLASKSKGFGLGALAGALLLGAAPMLVNFAFSMGQSVPDSATAAPPAKTSTTAAPRPKPKPKATTPKKP